VIEEGSTSYLVKRISFILKIDVYVCPSLSGANYDPITGCAIELEHSACPVL
jgi:hypothetical protein